MDICGRSLIRGGSGRGSACCVRPRADNAEVGGMTESLVVGVDPDWYGHGVVVLRPDGEEALRERVANEAASIGDPRRSVY